MSKIISVDIQILPDGRMDPKNAALYLGCSIKTLAMMRCTGKGPKFTKKLKIFYSKSDLDDWLKDSDVYNCTHDYRRRDLIQ